MRGVIDVDCIEVYLQKLDNQYNHGKFKSLILLDADSELTISARKLLIEEKKNRKGYFIAEAIVVTNFSQKLLASHYSIINGKYYHIKVFSTQNEAINWLNTIM